MIDTATIREKVLELAITGKLTENFKTVDNAETSYKQLVKVRNEAIGSKKISNKNYAVVDDVEKLFDIPENWKWVRIGEISLIVSKGTTPRGGNVAYLDSGIGFLRAENLKGYDKIDVSSLKYVDRDTHEGFLKRSILEAGDILISIAGTLGRTGIVREGDLPLNTNQAVAFIRVSDKTCISVEYVAFMLNASVIQRELGNKKVDMAIPNLSLDVISNAIIPLPPLEEQTLIVEKIRGIFAKLDEIDKLQQQYSSDLEVLKSKIIDAGIQGKLTEQLPEDGTAEDLLKQIEIQKERILKDRNGRIDKKIKDIDGDFPYDIPKHWRWIRFGNIGLFKKGPFGSALTKSMFVSKGDNTVKVYEQQHAIKKDSTLGNYYITREYFDDSMSGFEVLPGDIIVSCAGTIGETYIMPNNMEKGIINQALMRVTLVEGVNRKFFQYYFDAGLKKMAQEESNGSAIKNIPPFDVMKNWYFPIPSIEEQERIVSKIDMILKQIQ